MATSANEEINVLKSMYDESELIFKTDYSEEQNGRHIHSFLMRLLISDIRMEIDFQLPLGYPVCSRPVAFMRGNSIQETIMNQDLRKWIDNQPLNIPIVMDIVMWVQDNIDQYKKINVEPITPIPADIPESKFLYGRFYIHSHHLYSNTKRNDIIRLAKKLELHGFSTPGKPAVIVVEGLFSSCNSFWLEIKQWNWQRITVRTTDEFSDKSSLKFSTFNEIVLESADRKHVQTGEVKQILIDAGLEDKFNILYNL